MIGRTLIIFLVCCLSITIFSFVKNSPPVEKKQKVIRTIIVDAGHGIMANGGHNGAKGAYSYEDDICLAISKEFVEAQGGRIWVKSKVGQGSTFGFALPVSPA